MRVILLLITLPFIAHTQNNTFLQEAQNYVAAKQLDSALIAMEKACDLEPNNMDLWMYKGRIHTLNKDFKGAEKDLELVLEKYPNYTEARLLLSHVYVKLKALDKLKRFTITSLHTPLALEDSLTLIKAYVYSLLEQQRYKAAAQFLKPFKKQLYPLWNDTKAKSITNRLFANYTQYVLKSDQPKWQVVELEYIHRLPKLAFGASLNMASRQGKTGYQALFQAYPVLGKKAYAWLIGGISDGKTYSHYVYGGSFFLTVAKAFEAELGMRFLKVKENPEVVVLRGGLVYDNAVHRIGYNVSRISGTVDNGLVHSFYYQNYFKHDESYIRLGIGTGSIISNLLTPQFDNYTTNSLVASLLSQYCFNQSWWMVAGVSYENNKLLNNHQSRWIYNAGLIYKF